MFITSSLFTEVKEMHLVAATGHWLWQDKSGKRRFKVISYDHVEGSGRNPDGRGYKIELQLLRYQCAPANQLTSVGSFQNTCYCPPSCFGA